MADTVELIRPSSSGLPAIPWRDPHTVAPRDLAAYIEKLEAACLANPRSADLHTCLGMARAMNFQPYESADALERAIQLDPASFWAQLKYAELWYRLRALDKAEKEMLAALELAASYPEAALARKYLAEIRKLRREGTQKPAWTKSLLAPAAALGLLALLSTLVTWLR
jgi:tetratricopeptide (TPR) repeat protein